jgi:hypothetical protein
MDTGVLEKRDDPLNRVTVGGVCTCGGSRRENACPATKTRWPANFSRCGAVAGTGPLWRN